MKADKAALRRFIRQRKKDFSPEALQAESVRTMARVEALPQFREASVVAAYWSLPDEVYTHDFVRKWCGHKKILLPVMDEGCSLRLVPYTPDCRMYEADNGIGQPEGKTCDPHEAELILVPGMAFDPEGHRLGRGKGFYDRLLKNSGAYKAGVCFGFQVVGEVPSEPHDVRMDAVVYCPNSIR